MTIDQVLARYAATLDAAHTAVMEKNTAAMIADNLSDDMIEDLARLEAERWSTARAEALQQVRAWLRRDGEPLQ